MTNNVYRDEQSGLTYYEGGTGIDLLFLHGFGSSSEGYGPLLDKLSQEYHVIAPSLYSRTVANIPDAVERIETLLSRVGAGNRYLVVSYSNGSFAAALFTSRNAPRISRLILLAPMVKPGKLFFLDRGILLLFTLCRHFVISRDRYHVLRLLSVFTRNIIMNLPGMIAQLKDAYNMDITQIIYDTAVPVQIISGTADIVVPPTQGQMLHKALLSSTLTLLKGDHLMSFMIPDAIVSEIRNHKNQ